jgi:GTP-binding protein
MVQPLLDERGLRSVMVSALSHEGLRELSFAMAELVAAHRAAQQPAEATRIIITPTPVDDAGFIVTVETELDTGAPLYRVTGSRPERWVRQTDFSNDEAVGYLADRLARLGVEEALVEQGARAGSTVVIGPGDDAVVFDWEPTIIAGSGIAHGPRGTDERLAES